MIFLIKATKEEITNDGHYSMYSSDTRAALLSSDSKISVHVQ